MRSVSIAENGSYQQTASTATVSTTPLQTDRRREQRQALRETVGTSFYNNHRLYHASVTDLSSGGACLLFEVQSSDDMPKLYTGRKMECYFSTPGGRSKCRGTVRWIKQTESQLTWGLSFLELSSDGDDPLRIVISEICHNMAS